MGGAAAVLAGKFALEHLPPLRPKPNYGVSRRNAYYPVPDTTISYNIPKFFSPAAQGYRPSAPYVLNNFWWQLSEIDQSSAVAILDYTEDLNRYATGPMSTEFNPKPKIQRFHIRLHMQWKQMPRAKAQPVLTLVEYQWDIWNDRNYKSPTANQILDYTLAQFELYVGAPKLWGQSVRSRAPKPQVTVRKKAPRQEIEFTEVPKHITEQKHFWPTPQDFNESIQNPKIAFVDSELKSCAVETTELGLPKPMTGAFASVYRVQYGSKVAAVKCFLREVSDQAQRYKQISDYVLNDDLECTVGFDFIEEGILVRGKRYPILKMEWVEGLSLPEFIEEHRFDAPRMLKLCDDFYAMVEALMRAGVAHGDLQHGNIIICDNGLRLVDYDGMFVPGMEGMRSNELGHRNYQHPQRNERFFDARLDNFAAWIICLSLKAITIDPELWELPGAGDECLLLRQSDFRNPDGSPTMQKLFSHSNGQIREIAECIKTLCKLPLECIPSLSAETHELLPSDFQANVDNLVASAQEPVWECWPNDEKPRSNLPDWML